VAKAPSTSRPKTVKGGVAKAPSTSRPKSEMDRVQRERVDSFMKSYHNSDAKIERVFLSEKVYDTVKEEKVLLNSYDLSKILSFLPLSRNIYVSICPRCLSKGDVDKFRSLVERGVIIPALVAPYEQYQSTVQSLVTSHDHISYFEFSAFRSTVLRANVNKMICVHCAGLKRDDIVKTINKHKALPTYKDGVNIIMRNLFPFIYPDFELLNSVHEAGKKGSKTRFEQLVRLSYMIKDVRSAQAFNAPIVMDESEISKIPAGFAKASDEALLMSAGISERISNGLGLKIPSDIPIEKYIEIDRDFQPKISVIINDIKKSSTSVDPIIAVAKLNLKSASFWS
jgi:hypothetical protein